MNLQHERIAMMCERLRLARMACEWPALAQQAACLDSPAKAKVAANIEATKNGRSSFDFMGLGVRPES